MLILPPEEVHVWSARQESTLPPGIEATLSADERARAERFYFPQHRLAYVFAHGVLRDVLSRYLHCSREAIRFVENEFGKPLLVHRDEGTALEFNMAHSGGLVVVALSCGRRIGIDVEEIRAIDDSSAISDTCFTSNERAFVTGQQDSDRNRAFWSCWTRKEAYVKAVGKGLSIPLNSFDTLISNLDLIVFLESPPGSTDQVRWQVANLNLQRGYAAAVAVESGANRVIHLAWPHALQTNGEVDAR